MNIAPSNPKQPSFGNRAPIELMFCVDTIKGSSWNTPRQSWLGGWWPDTRQPVKDDVLEKYDVYQYAVARGLKPCYMIDMNHCFVDDPETGQEKGIYDPTRLAGFMSNRYHPSCHFIQHDLEGPMTHPWMLPIERDIGGDRWKDEHTPDATSYQTMALWQRVHSDTMTIANNMNGYVDIADWQSTWLPFNRGQYTNDMRAAMVYATRFAYANAAWLNSCCYPQLTGSDDTLKLEDMVGHMRYQRYVNSLCMEPGQGYATTLHYRNYHRGKDRYIGDENWADYLAASIQILRPRRIYIWTKDIEKLITPNTVIPEDTVTELYGLQRRVIDIAVDVVSKYAELAT